MGPVAPNPYRLFMSLRSPFARRVRIAMLRMGIPFEMETLNVFEPTEEFLKANPLGLVPVLQTPRGPFLPDSAAILQYLHDHHGERIWPKDPFLKLTTQVASVLAEGIMTATVAYFLETERKAPSPEWLEEYSATLHRALKKLSIDDPAGPPWVIDGVLTQAAYDLAVGLEYLDLRLPSLAWRHQYPLLTKVYDRCQVIPAIDQTRPPPA